MSLAHSKHIINDFIPTILQVVPESFAFFILLLGITESYSYLWHLSSQSSCVYRTFQKFCHLRNSLEIISSILLAM